MNSDKRDSLKKMNSLYDVGSCSTLPSGALNVTTDQWVTVQHKTFIRWINIKLKNIKGYKEIDNLSIGLKDGLVLIKLIETLTNEPFKYDYFRECKREMHCQANISCVLRVLNSLGIKTVNVDAFDIFNGNLKLILGIIWTIILKYELLMDSDSKNSSKAARKELLDWCNLQLNEFGLKMRNFYSWGNGKCLAALVHVLKHEGNKGFYVDEDEPPIDVIEKYIEIAHNDHFIDKIIDPEDFLSGIDPYSCMTYISLIKNEFEGGPERRAKKRKNTPILINSKIYLEDSHCIIELRNADNEIVPNNDHQKFLAVKCEFTPINTKTKSFLKTEIVPITDGKYKVNLLQISSGIYMINGKYKEENLSKEPVELKIQHVEGNVDISSEIISKGNKITLSVNFDKNVKLSVEDVTLWYRIEKEKEDDIEWIEIKNTEKICTDGKFKLDFVPTELGKYMIKATIFNNDLDNIGIFYVENPIFQIEGTGFTNGKVEEPQTIKIKSVDSKGALLKSNCKPIMYLNNKIKEENPTPIYTLDDLLDGQFNLCWVPKDSGDFNVEVKVDDSVILNQDIQIKDSPHPPHSTLEKIKIKSIKPDHYNASFQITLYNRKNEKLKESMDSNITVGYIRMKSDSELALTNGIKNATEENEEKSTNSDHILNQHQIMINDSVIDNKDGTLSFNINDLYVGLYELIVKINGEFCKGSPFKIVLESTPKWSIHKDEFKNEHPNVEQKMTFILKNNKGVVFPYLESLICHIKQLNKENEQKIMSLKENDYHLFKWIPSNIGIYKIEVFDKEDKIFEKELYIKSEPYVPLCILELQSQKIENVNVAMFQITLKDRKDKILSIGGDLKSIYAGVKVKAKNINKAGENGIRGDNGKIENPNEIKKSQYEEMQVTDKNDGRYEFTYKTSEYGMFEVVAGIEKHFKNSPLTVAFEETFDTLLDYLKIKNNDRFFTKFVEKMQKDQIYLKKHRMKRSVFTKKFSKHTLKLHSPMTKDACIEFHNLKIFFINISAIESGKTTVVLRRKSKINLESGKCFSIISNERTVDFETTSEEEQMFFVRGLNILLHKDYIRKNSMYEMLE